MRRTAGNVRPLVAGPPKDPRLAARAASGAAAAAVKRASATTPQAGSGPRPPAKRHKADHNARSGIAEAFDESDVEMNAFDIELEEAWDNTSELNEDDLDAIQDENERWWGHEGGADVDVGEEPPEQAWQDRPEQDHEALAAVSDIPLGFSLHGESGLGATPAASHTPPAPPALGRPHGAFNATQLSDHGSPYQSTPRGPAFLSQTHPGVGRAPLGRPLAGPPVPSRFTSPSGRRERR